MRAEEREDAETQPVRLLIVNGSEKAARALARRLRNSLFDVLYRRAGDPRSLESALREQTWDFVFCAHSLNGLCAHDVLERVLSHDPNLPVIVLGAPLEAEELIGLFRRGAQDVVPEDDFTSLEGAIRRELAETRAKHEKRRAETRLTSAINCISEGVALYDSNDRLVLCNDRYRDFFDTAAEHLIPGTSFEDILRALVRHGQIPVSGKHAEQHIQWRLKRHFNPQDPFEQTLGDGRRVRVQERRTEDGSILAVLTDISERKAREEKLGQQARELERFNQELRKENRLRQETEASLRDSETRARAIFESAVDGVITFDENCVIESVNPATERLFGYAAEELVGQQLFLLIPCHDCKESGAAICELPSGFGAKSSGIHALEGIRKDGSTVPVEWTISETNLEGGRIFTAIVRDISERLKLDKMKTEFVSVVGHELRTPLTSIKGSLALLQSQVTGRLPEKAASMITIAYKNTERLVRLINDILDIEKIESGTIPFEFQPVNLSQMIDQAIEGNQSFADQFHVVIRRGDPKADCWIMADPNRLIQVLTNLISNAVKFSPEGGAITLDTEPQDGIVRISVTDQGPGIPEDFHDKIFEKFSQADGSDSRKLDGTGLGLSIAKAIVERHGGRMGFDTAEAGGTTFHFDLPAWSEESQKESPGDTAGSGGGNTKLRPLPAGRRPKVLICDGNREVRDLLRKQIGEIGYAVDTCATAATARKRLHRKCYAAMTLDIALPKQSAIDLVRELREAPETRDLPIIAVSAETEHDKARLSGCAFSIIDWMHSPFNISRLRTDVQRAAMNSRGRRPRILHVEDNEDHLAIVARIAGDLADIEAARNRREASTLLKNQDFDLVILDLLLPDARGESLLPLIFASGPYAPPVLIFSVKEVPQPLLAHVAGALVKTKASNELLTSQIREILQTGKLKQDIRLFA